MTALSIKPFSGLVPRVSDRLLDTTQATRAINCRLDTGELRAWNGTSLAFSLSKAGTIQSIYRWNADPTNEAAGFWFHWTEDVDVVRGPVTNDTQERTYYTGVGTPKMTYAGIATAGGTDYPENSYELGVPAPASTPTATIAGTPDIDADPDLDLVTRSYVVTYVSGMGEEGPPSQLSATVDWLPGQTVDLVSIPAAPAGNYNITHKRIYRTATGASGTDLYFVVELPIATATYNDSVLDSALGSPLETTDYYAPPADLHSLNALPAGFLFGFSNNNVCFSETYLPHAWNPDNQLPLSHPIVGGGYFGNTVVACTQKNPYVISGTDPAAMIQDELNINQGCVSKRSIVSTRYGVIYASPDGLILIGPNGPENLTAKFLLTEQWRALKPSSILGTVFEDKYFGFYDDGVTQGCFILDPTNPSAGLIYSDVYATGAYVDPLADKLYLVVGNAIHAWNEGSALTYIWKSKAFYSPDISYLTAARVQLAGAGTVTARFYVDDVLVHTETVNDDNPFRMKAVRGRKYQVELEGTAAISQLDWTSEMSELSRL